MEKGKGTKKNKGSKRQKEKRIAEYEKKWKVKINIGKIRKEVIVRKTEIM